MLARRKIVDLAPVETVSHTNLELRQPVQDVKLSQRQAVDAAGADGLADEHGIEPAATPRSAGHGAEFPAALADETTDVVRLLGGEWPLPHPGRVGLADAEHVPDRRRPEPRAGRGLRRYGVG